MQLNRENNRPNIRSKILISFFRNFVFVLTFLPKRVWRHCEEPVTRKGELKKTCLKTSLKLQTDEDWRAACIFQLSTREVGRIKSRRVYLRCKIITDNLISWKWIY